MSKPVHAVNKFTPVIMFSANLKVKSITTFDEEVSKTGRQPPRRGPDHIFLPLLRKCCIISSSDRNPLPQPRRQPVFLNNAPGDPLWDQVGRDMTKRKDERRELLKEDDIHSFLERVGRYIQQNFMQVVFATVAAFALVAGLIAWVRYQGKQQNEQAAVLYTAEKILNADPSDPNAEKFASERERYEKALGELDKVIASTSGVVRQQALLHKIKVLNHLGQQDKIEPLYQEVIKKDEGLKVFGLVGLGNFYISEGKFKEAREQFEIINTLRGVPDLKDFVDYQRAFCFKQEGDKSSAQKELKLLVDRYANEEDAAKKPPILTKAQQLLDELNKELGTATESPS